MARRKGLWTVVVSGAAIAGLGMVPAAGAAGAAPHAKASVAVARAATEVLVRFRPGVSSNAIGAANRSAGVSVERHFTAIDGLYLVRASGQSARDRAVRTYRSNHDVAYAEANYTIGLDGGASYSPDLVTPDDPDFAQQWSLNNTGQLGGKIGADIDAEKAWKTSKGSPDVVVGLIDTGVQLDHPDLAANIYKNEAECNGTPGVDDDHNGYVDDCHGIDTINGDSDPSDDFGHGTHTAGTIGAIGNNGVGVTGVNWHVSILPCKSHDSMGEATAASVIECLQYMLIMKGEGANIVTTSNSYGGCTEACSFDPALHDAIAAQMTDNILFVASAGNDASDNDKTPVFPATYFLPNVIAVAATSSADVRAGFSNWGLRTVELGAPGVSVLSTYFGSRYASLSGTSMAAPHVSGVVALLAAADPARDYRALRNLVLAGVDRIPALATNTVTGGRLNAAKSLTCTDRAAFGVLRPLESVKGGKQTTIAVLNINCAAPAGALSATVTPGGTHVKLKDDGAGADLAAADGIYSAGWAPPKVTSRTKYTLTFSTGQHIVVSVLP